MESITVNAGLVNLLDVIDIFHDVYYFLVLNSTDDHTTKYIFIGFESDEPSIDIIEQLKSTPLPDKNDQYYEVYESVQDTKYFICSINMFQFNRVCKHLAEDPEINLVFHYDDECSMYRLDSYN